MGIIFNIEEFAIYDGPGIRTAVFLKGCPLRCIWCHNPEGINKEPEVMKKTGRICGYEISADELASKLMKNIDFYESSSGGVTISGGEPFEQSEFLFELISKLKGLHTSLHIAVETSGYTSSEIFNKALDCIDLFIMDIKHADSKTHKKLTGVENGLILTNLEILKNSGKPFIIRVPLIPGINDSNQNLYDIAELLANCENLLQVELLPYNKLTGGKYKSLGREYSPPFGESKEPNINQEYFMKAGIRSVIL
jgi:pyruvate formate lyase activating enzyme